LKEGQTTSRGRKVHSREKKLMGGLLNRCGLTTSGGEFFAGKRKGRGVTRTTSEGRY